MRARRWAFRGMLACTLVGGHARADEPPPIVVEPPAQEPLPSLPAPAPTPPPFATPSATPSAAAAPVPAPPPPARSSVGGLGVGATYFGASGHRAARGGSRGIDTGGLVLEAKTRIPIGAHFGIGVRGAWGLTEFQRIEEVARPGYRIGKWTGKAYEDVWNWAGEGESNSRIFRVLGAFFAFMGLAAPLMVAGMFYVASPFAATTYFELDLTGTYDFGADGRNGPYAKLGAGLVGYFHPRSNDAYGGVGPTASLGYRTGPLDLALGGTYLPPGAHGGSDEHILIGAITIAFAH